MVESMEKAGFRKLFLNSICISNVIFFSACSDSTNSEPIIELFCAASLREPVEEIVKGFEASQKVRVVTNFGGSGALSAQMRMVGADVFLPADKSFLVALEQDGLIMQTHSFLKMNAVLVIRQKFEFEGELEELLQQDVKLSLGDPSTAIGRHVRDHLKHLGLWNLFREKLVSEKPTVVGSLNDVRLGAADATIVWRPIVKESDNVRVLSLGEAFAEGAEVAFGISVSEQGNTYAEDFVNYMHGQGMDIFSKYNFSTNGD